MEEEVKVIEADVKISNHGGKRPGAGPKRRHTAPVRMLKVRATDEQWEIISRVLPHDTAVRAAFLAALESLDTSRLLDADTKPAIDNTDSLAV